MQRTQFKRKYVLNYEGRRAICPQNKSRSIFFLKAATFSLPGIPNPALRLKIMINQRSYLQTRLFTAVSRKLGVKSISKQLFLNTPPTEATYTSMLTSLRNGTRFSLTCEMWDNSWESMKCHCLKQLVSIKFNPRQRGVGKGRMKQTRQEFLRTRNPPKQRKNE